MWIMMNDAFFSIVRKDCPPGQLLVRARRPGDIEKVFGRHVVVERDYCADYLFRARIPQSDVAEVMEREISRIDYGNFKNSVVDVDLHDAYMSVWDAMAGVQPTPPYSGRSKGYTTGEYLSLPTHKSRKQKPKTNGAQQQKGEQK